MLRDLLPLLVVAGTAAVVMVLFLVVRGLRERSRAFWRRRLHGSAGPEPVSLIRADFGARPPTRWSERMDRAFDRMIQQTGLGWAPAQALGWMTLTAVVLGGALLLWRGDLGLTGLGLVVGLVVPLGIYRFLHARWRQRLQHQLPDALFLLARSLRAGLSLEQALATVAEHGTRPLADEFRRAGEQMKYGLTVPAALEGMARRLQLPDFNIFVTAVIMHRKMGGNLIRLLERVASSTRDRNLFRGYFRAATALGRITSVCVCAAAPMIFLSYTLWQPELVRRFFESGAGLRALGAAATLEVIGAVWLFSLLRVDY